MNIPSGGDCALQIETVFGQIGHCNKGNTTVLLTQRPVFELTLPMEESKFKSRALSLPHICFRWCGFVTESFFKHKHFYFAPWYHLILFTYYSMCDDHFGANVTARPFVVYIFQWLHQMQT